MTRIVGCKGVLLELDEVESVFTKLKDKRSRRGDREIDDAVELVLRDSGAAHRVVGWEPWGGDERQFCSPGFDLPVGCLMRTPHGEFAGYHTSADGLERIGSLAALLRRAEKSVGGDDAGQ